ncbi:MAG TPA: ABC transporter permease [Thermoanaerobaculia bacterium]|nr:ABC transporter permease [Thermoanaerobaculia bacterium]
MSVADLVLFALRSLLGHRLRTVLSLVGMSIGVGAVILLTSLGEGARRYVTDQFSSIGSNLVIVFPGRNETTGFFPGSIGVPHDLTLEDVEAVLRSVREVARIAPVVVGQETVSYRERRRTVPVMGTTRDLMVVQEFGMAAGSFLPAGDLRRGAPLVVLGSETARELFSGGEQPIGAAVRIGDRRARVIGVIEPRGLQVGVDFDDIAVIPVVTAMQLFNRSSLFRMILQIRSHADLETARRNVRQVLIERHDGEQDFTILTQDAVVDTLGTILGVLTLALVAIAAISLSVAGIGIMNVMLVSVSERTSEIGLLRAIGARRRQILAVFLAEAALLSTAGGVLGVVLGASGALAVVVLYPEFPAQPPWWAVVAAIAVALGFGLLFGTLPARRATTLDPIEALKKA